MHIPLDYFVLSEAKLDNSFPCTQLQVSSYKKRARRAPDKRSG